MKKLLEAPAAVARLENELGALRDALERSRGEHEARDRKLAELAATVAAQAEDIAALRTALADARDASTSQRDEATRHIEEQAGRLDAIAARQDRDHAGLRDRIDALRLDLSRQSEEAAGVAAVMFDRIEAAKRGRADLS